MIQFYEFKTGHLNILVVLFNVSLLQYVYEPSTFKQQYLLM